ncbi:hypothetical protein SAMN05421748_14444 [Paractinoplanes atraurantiacus]|uniref:Uncharacterized protein n=1 Tax=Paractinoplanes atraurantiacus TaxID=1036182 RepID=A0A285KJV2_9ACTN|nr:hypothetical protein SAMN05421748_14444 [Actinoplanes atraurantiacus]
MEACPSRAWIWAGVGAAVPEPSGVGVAQPVRAQAGQVGVGADGEDDLGDAGDGEPAALAGGGPGLRPRSSSQAQTALRPSWVQRDGPHCVRP